MADLIPWFEALRLSLLGRLLLALALGAAIGLERELSGKPAGLRTNILICLGAALFTELSVVVAGQFVPHDLIRSDPARIAAQIVSGIGFIGAGTIMVARGNVLGLTTAATLWVVAAIGMAVGLHLYLEAVGATVLVVLTLVALGHFEARVLEERGEQTLTVVMRDPQASPGEVEDLLGKLDLEYTRIGHDRTGDRAEFTFGVWGPQSDRDRLLKRLAERESVRGARVE